VPVDFKQGGDTGEDNVNSIQPISNGEPVNQVTLRRPDENLRKRTEVLKSSVLYLDSRGREEHGSYISTLGGLCYIDAESLGASGAIPAQPGLWKFSPYSAYPVVVASSSIAGGKVVLRESDFNTFYTNPATKENHLAKKGDTLALKFPRNGTDSRTNHSWGNEVEYPFIATGNIAPEAQLIKLPERTVLNNSGLTLLTDLGPDGLDLVDADGIPVASDTLFLAITDVLGKADDWWFDNGGRGGTKGADTDYLEVSRVGETFVEVVATTPFRILWGPENEELTWSLYTKDAGVYTAIAATGSAGYITEKDYSDYNIVPIVTYDGEGFVFHNGGGYLPVDLGTARLSSFILPVSVYAELLSIGEEDEGALGIGSKRRSSSGDADVYGSIDLYGGVNLEQGTLSAQLDRLVKQAARRVRCLSRRVTHEDLSGATTVVSLDLNDDCFGQQPYLSTKDRVVKVRFTVDEEWALTTVSDSLTMTISIGATTLLSNYPLAGEFNTALVGSYDVPLSSTVYDLSPPDLGTTGTKVTVSFTSVPNLNSPTAGSVQVFVEVREVP
jgi:hypothetical protein